MWMNEIIISNQKFTNKSVRQTSHFEDGGVFSLYREMYDYQYN